MARSAEIPAVLDEEVASFLVDIGEIDRVKAGTARCLVCKDPLNWRRFNWSFRLTGTSNTTSKQNVSVTRPQSTGGSSERQIGPKSHLRAAGQENAAGAISRFQACDFGVARWDRRAIQSSGSGWRHCWRTQLVKGGAGATKPRSQPECPRGVNPANGIFVDVAVVELGKRAKPVIGSYLWMRCHVPKTLRKVSLN